MKQNITFRLQLEGVLPVTPGSFSFWQVENLKASKGFFKAIIYRLNKLHERSGSCLSVEGLHGPAVGKMQRFLGQKHPMKTSFQPSGAFQPCKPSVA